MHSYYINLASRGDRRERMEAEMARVGLRAERVEGTFVDNNRIQGCALSHAEALQRGINAGGTEAVLVLEDDVEFMVDGATLRDLCTFVPHDYDVLMLGYGGLEGEPVAASYGRVRAAHNAHAYLVAPHYLGTLRASILESAALIERHSEIHWLFSHDQYWKTLQRSGTWYYTIPMAARQVYSYSDISMRYVQR